MTRTVTDAAAELGAIAGKDPEDPATATAPDTVPDYLAGLKPDALAGRRIGVITSTNVQYQAAVATIQKLGAIPVQLTAPSAPGSSSILFQEFKRDLAAYFSRLPANAPMKTLADVIAYNDAHPDDALKYGQVTALQSQATDLTDPAQYAAYVETRDTGRARAGRDRHRAHGEQRRGDHDPGHVDHRRSAAQAGTRRSGSPLVITPPTATRSASR